jgi:hypothetical protein
LRRPSFGWESCPNAAARTNGQKTLPERQLGGNAASTNYSRHTYEDSARHPTQHSHGARVSSVARGNSYDPQPCGSRRNPALHLRITQTANLHSSASDRCSASARTRDRYISCLNGGGISGGIRLYTDSSTTWRDIVPSPQRNSFQRLRDPKARVLRPTNLLPPFLRLAQRGECLSESAADRLLASSRSGPAEQARSILGGSLRTRLRPWPCTPGPRRCTELCTEAPFGPVTNRRDSNALTWAVPLAVAVAVTSANRGTGGGGASHL